MEELLARERAAEQSVQYLLNERDEPVDNLLHALHEYRAVCQAAIFADFENGGAERETRLWQAHTESKKYFHSHLSTMKKKFKDMPVACRQLVKLFLQFLKESLLFYRQYIRLLNTAYGGIPELEAVAHQVKEDGSGESSQPSISPALRHRVLTSCHQTLIYLGDLSRYRASEKLDKTPDFGPAIGYYGLACSLWPSSGLGFHQQAVIALDQQQHLRAIYHLYRAIVVEEPHPNAAQNLKREFDKINAAWDRGELIRKGGPNDPEAAKQTLTGWFVRLHSMCFKGEPFRGFEELEREILGQLSAQLKQHDIGSALMRMVMTNLSAQFNATTRFQAQQTQQSQTAFLRFFRFNIKTYTTLLHVFHDELRMVDPSGINNEDVEELAGRLSGTARRILPSLRLYTAWLLPSTTLLEGLSSDDTLRDAIELFWPIYAKVVDLVAATFPIWDLEDLPEITYMLEEDADTLGFKPLVDETTKKIWYEATSGHLKARFSDMGVQRMSAEEEVLLRVKDFLGSGLFLANDDSKAPIKLQATRILHRDAQDVAELPMPTFPKKVVTPPPPPPVEPPKLPAIVKPLSYAAAATNGAASGASRTSRPIGESSASSRSRHAQLSRMVDDLVGDGDNIPTTPPQKRLPAPAPTNRTPQGSLISNGNAQDRLQSVANLWPSPAPLTSQSPAGLPTGSLGSPAHIYSRSHSRVNSASSIRSRTSQSMVVGIADSWSSLDSGHRAKGPNGVLNGLGFDPSNTGSPLLFGAGDSVWSTSPKPPRQVSPPNGQGG